MFPSNTEHPWLFLVCYPRQVGWQESNPAVPGFSSISTFPDNNNTRSGLSKSEMLWNGSGGKGPLILYFSYVSKKNTYI